MTQAANLAALGTNAGTTGILPAAGGGTGTASGVTGFKNRIINGAMVIDQRNAGASVTINNAGGFTYTLDRWNMYVSQNSKCTVQQNAGAVTPPAGFTNYLGLTSLSAYTVGSAELFDVNQMIEGLNVADLAWGTASAKTVTLSFWVRSSLTGTFGGAILNHAQNRSYPFSYSISSANTWEQKSITIAGDTSGTWLTNNSRGIFLSFGVGVGSTLSGTAGSWSGNSFFSATGATSVVGTNGATWYITGVQLEVGSTATSFDYRPYGTELALCQRYYFQNSVLTGISGFSFVAAATNEAMGSGKFPVTMRANPTVTTYGNLGTSGQANIYGTGDISGVSAGRITFDTFTSVVKTSGWSVGNIISGNYSASAEL
jgi:hypothetical protein